jgi:superfamily II DNA or RNA helicase
MTTPIALRPHQFDAFNAIKFAISDGKGIAKGRIIMPTGSGKTFVEAAVIDYQQSLASIAGDHEYTRIHLVLAPRIMLANQLIGEIRAFGGQEFRAIAFHSGVHEPEYDQIKWQEESTTKVSKVQDHYIKAKSLNQHLIVFSTYHSCDKLAGIKFDTIIADESQYCVSENFNNAIRTLDAKVTLFFTATEKHTASDNGRGLNNETIYGKKLYSITPAKLIQLGLIVAPRLHIMHGTTKDESRSIVDEVIELAVEQHAQTVGSLGFSKILFAMKGTDDVKTISDNLRKINEKLPDHDLFCITSKTGAILNGVKIRRDEFLRKLKSSKNSLIFHYDILSEGIDVDGITGVALLRNMSLAKMLQTIGRAVRIYKPNPALKKQALISVTVLNGDEDDMTRVREVVRCIRDGGFDIGAENVIETGITRHQSDEEDIDDAYGKYKPNLSLFSIENVFHQIEEDDFWNKIHSTVNVEDKIDSLFA